MIKTKDSIHGHRRLNSSSQVLCDKCGEDCTDNFVDVFINEIKERPSVTASYPFEEVKKENKQYCKKCIQEIWQP